VIFLNQISLLSYFEGVPPANTAQVFGHLLTSDNYDDDDNKALFRSYLFERLVIDGCSLPFNFLSCLQHSLRISTWERHVVRTQQRAVFHTPYCSRSQVGETAMAQSSPTSSPQNLLPGVNTISANNRHVYFLCLETWIGDRKNYAKLELFRVMLKHQPSVDGIRSKQEPKKAVKVFAWPKVIECADGKRGHKYVQSWENNMGVWCSTQSLFEWWVMLVDRQWLLLLGCHHQDKSKAKITKYSGKVAQ